MTFQILVQDRRNGSWRNRTTVTHDSKGRILTDQNDALRAYGIAGSRPRLGEASSKSGKRFRAVPVTATAKADKPAAKAKPAAKKSTSKAKSTAKRGNARRTRGSK